MSPPVRTATLGFLPCAITASASTRFRLAICFGSFAVYTAGRFQGTESAWLCPKGLSKRTEARSGWNPRKTWGRLSISGSRKNPHCIRLPGVAGPRLSQRKAPPGPALHCKYEPGLGSPDADFLNPHLTIRAVHVTHYGGIEPGVALFHLYAAFGLYFTLAEDRL